MPYRPVHPLGELAVVCLPEHVGHSNGRVERLRVLRRGPELQIDMPPARTKHPCWREIDLGSPDDEQVSLMNKCSLSPGERTESIVPITASVMDGSSRLVSSACWQTVCASAAEKTRDLAISRR